MESYVVGVEEIAWGVALVAITMVLHGMGMVWTLRGVHRLKSRLGTNLGLAASLLLLVVAAWLITLTHLVEVFAWAGFFVWKGALPNGSSAYYLALLDYTTLGCEYELPQNWRLMFPAATTRLWPAPSKRPALETAEPSSASSAASRTTSTGSRCG